MRTHQLDARRRTTACWQVTRLGSTAAVLGMFVGTVGLATAVPAVASIPAFSGQHLDRRGVVTSQSATRPVSLGRLPAEALESRLQRPSTETLILAGNGHDRSKSRQRGRRRGRTNRRRAGTHTATGQGSGEPSGSGAGTSASGSGQPGSSHPATSTAPSAGAMMKARDQAKTQQRGLTPRSKAGGQTAKGKAPATTSTTPAQPSAGRLLKVKDQAMTNQRGLTPRSAQGGQTQTGGPAEAGTSAAPPPLQRDTRRDGVRLTGQGGVIENPPVAAGNVGQANPASLPGGATAPVPVPQERDTRRDGVRLTGQGGVIQGQPGSPIQPGSPTQPGGTNPR